MATPPKEMMDWFLNDFEGRLGTNLFWDASLSKSILSDPVPLPRMSEPLTCSKPRQDGPFSEGVLNGLIDKMQTKRLCTTLDMIDKTPVDEEVSDLDVLRAQHTLGSFAGIKIVTSPYAVKTVYNFQPSKNRSNRITKKLMKRYGSMIKKVPCVFLFNGQAMVHPAIMVELERLSETKGDDHARL